MDCHTYVVWDGRHLWNPAEMVYLRGLDGFRWRPVVSSDHAIAGGEHYSGLGL